jgi:hypothetical protein
MKQIIPPGTVNFIAHVFIQNSAATTGVGLTGLTNATASLAAYYIRPGDAAPTAITLANSAVGTWANGNFKEVNATTMPGIYELGYPNPAVAAGVAQCAFLYYGAANMAPLPIEVQLSNYAGETTVASINTTVVAVNSAVANVNTVVTAINSAVTNVPASILAAAVDTDGVTAVNVRGVLRAGLALYSGDRSRTPNLSDLTRVNVAFKAPDGVKTRVLMTNVEVGTGNCNTVTLDLTDV